MQLQEELCPFPSFTWVKSGSQEQNLFSFDCFCIMLLKAERTPTINDALLDNNNVRLHFNSFGDSAWEQRAYPTNHDKDLCWTLATPTQQEFLKLLFPFWDCRLRSATFFLILLSSLVLFQHPFNSLQLLLSSHMLSNLILLPQMVLEVQSYGSIRFLQMRQAFKILQRVSSNSGLTSSDLLSIQTNRFTYSLPHRLPENPWLQITFIPLR